MRTAAHNILYTTANGWQYENGEPEVDAPVSHSAIYGVWGVTAVLAVGLEVLTIMKYLKRRKAVAAVEALAPADAPTEA